MDNIFKNKLEDDNNIYNRHQKDISSFELYLVSKKKNFTNNILFYFLCIIFSFIPLAILSGDFLFFFKQNSEQKSYQEFLKILTCHNLIEKLNLSYKIYCIIYLIIMILLIFRIIINYYIIKDFHKYKYINELSFSNKYKNIIEHIIFLLFPYILEFLSFPYYIYFFSEKFIIKLENKNNYLIYLNMLFSAFLIIIYNINNYFGMISSNRMNTISLFDAYFNINTGKKNKTIEYRTSNYIFYIYIFLQNFIIILPLDNYCNNSRIKLLLKIVYSIIIIITILILILSRLQTFNYNNFINISVNLLLLFCFYSIIFDFYSFIFNIIIKNYLIQIIYLLIKFFFSFATHSLLTLKINNYLESKILNILFQEKSNKNENKFINALYYLHQIMLKIKDNNEIDTIFLFAKFLYKHIKKCDKPICNCILLKPFFQIEFKNKTGDDLSSNYYLNNFKNNLNYLFECSFIELDYCNKYELAILLSEHFYHMKNNPIMAFSLIKTLIQKKKKSFSKFQIINLYELEQKYIYYLSAYERIEIEEYLKNNNKELLLNKLVSDNIKFYYSNLKLSCQAKNLITKYIKNRIKILKYKNIFEDSLSYKYDENNENIISVKMSFFENSTKIDNLYDNSKQNDINQKNDENKTNLNFIVGLLNEESHYYFEIIDLINKMDIGQNTPIFIIFKFFIFYDIFGGGKLPKEITSKLYNSLSGTNNVYNNDLTNEGFEVLVKKYKEQNNRINSKHYAIFELKKDIRTKYYSEVCALKLGFRQKDIINNKIDRLMPNEFSTSHQNIIKRLIIGNQMKNFNFLKNYFFDSTSTSLYSVSYNGILNYSISKNLNIMFEWVFNTEKEYQFMLNANFDLIANSKNFELEYYLNKNIFQTYNIKLIDILKINTSIFDKKYGHDIRNLKYQNYIRKVKTEEYFIPQFYVPKGEKNAGMMNSSLFNISKNNMLNKFIKISKQEENSDEYKNNLEDEEEKATLIEKKIWNKK